MTNNTIKSATHVRTKKEVEQLLESDISTEQKVELLADLAFHLFDNQKKASLIINTILEQLNNMESSVAVLKHQAC